MGAPASSGSQVYYDTNTKQYYTINTPTAEDSKLTAINRILSPIYNNTSDSEKLRSYIVNPYSLQQNYNSFVPTNPTIDNLFPGLNIGLTQGIINAQQPNGAMYGAGKYLNASNLLGTPTTTTSESKGK